MVLRSSDCPVHLLPDEILRKLLSHERLSFVDRVAAQQVCLRWRDMLSAPQAGACRVWGAVELEAATLAGMACYGSTSEQDPNQLGQPMEVGRLLPLCRWLADRAPGMLQLSLNFTNLYHPRLSRDIVESAATSMLVVLLALLGGSRVDIILQLPGRRALHDLLSHGCILSKLSQHLVNLSAYLPPEDSEQGLINICGLCGLTSLTLIDKQRSIAAIPPQIGQLTALKNLLIDTWSYQGLTVPAAFSNLQQLTSVSLAHAGNIRCKHIFCSLPKLLVLDIHQQHPSSYGRLRPLARVAPEMTGLGSLTSLNLEGRLFGNSFHGLSSLHSLRQLELQEVELALGESAASLSKAWCSLTTLTCVRVGHCSTGLDTAALSVLTGLKSLTFEKCHLRTFMCYSSWRALTSLSLQHNALSCMPSNLTALTALVELDLGFQLAIFQLHESLLNIIRALPSIKVIDLNHMLSEWDASSLFWLIEAREASSRMSPGLVIFDGILE